MSKTDSIPPPSSGQARATIPPQSETRRTSERRKRPSLRARLRRADADAGHFTREYLFGVEPRSFADCVEFAAVRMTGLLRFVRDELDDNGSDDCAALDLVERVIADLAALRSYADEEGRLQHVPPASIEVAS